MDLHDFPHDIQICEVILMSELYTMDEVIVYWDRGTAFRGSTHLILPQFVIEKLHVIDCCNYTYDYGRFSCVEGQIHLRRLLGFFIINIYLPTILIVAMSMLTFWIPPDAVPARVTLGVTSLLTMITKQYGAEMPNVSYIVALNVWLSSCIAFVFSSLLEYAVVMACSNIGIMGNRIDSSHSERKVTPIVAFSPDADDEKISTKESLMNKMTFCDNLVPEHIDIVSRFLFPTLFVSYCIAYFIMYN